MRIVFFGSSKFVLPILEVLRKNYDLPLVITTEKNPTETVPSYCKKYSIPFLSIRDLSDPTIRYTLNAIRPSLAVLAYFGLILPKDVLDLFPKGILNVHPSLLPKYRGPTPGQSAILAGDKITGETIIKLDEEVDHGPILASKKEPIHTVDTAETLYERLFKKGADLLKDSIKSYLKGELKPKEQDHTKATFTEDLTRQSGYFDSNNPPLPEKLDRMIRAYHPWPSAWTKIRIRNQELRIKFLPPISHPELDSGSHNFLLQVEGKNPMSYKDFLNGYPEARELLEKFLSSNF